jgi:hypothetical protein
MAHRLITVVAALVFSSATRAQTPGEAPTLYEMKAGVFEMSVMKGVGKNVVYFDDFGRKKATYKTISILPGQEKHSLKIELPDGTSYDIDLDTKTGTRMRVPPVPPEAAKMLAGAMGAKKVKDLPTKDFLGKPCKGIEAEALGMITRSWTWKGIVLHSEITNAKGGGQPIVTDVTKVSEEPVPPEKFDVPAGVQIQGL